MVPSTSLSLVAGLVLSFTLHAVASPFPLVPREMPAEASVLALDESTGKVIAYDDAGTFLGRFDLASPLQERSTGSPGACVDISTEDVYKLPGWKKLENAANQHWGDGAREIVTNDRSYPEYPAQVCVDDSPVTIRRSKAADCEETVQSLAGEFVGTQGTVTLDYLYGTQFTTSNTVTKQSSIAIGAKVSASVKVEVVEVGVEVSTVATFTNSLSNTETVGVNTQSRSAITMEAPLGKTCHLNFKHKSCMIRGTGSVRFVAAGWVWFQYHDRTNGHYKWALRLDAYLPGVEERSSTAEFKSLVQSSTRSDFRGACQ